MLVRKESLNTNFFIIAATLLFIIICASMIDYFTPVLGDDLGKMALIGSDDYRLLSLSPIKFIGRHYLSVNGRILDSVGPAIIFTMPRVLASIIMGCMVGFYYYIMLKSSDLLTKNSLTASLFFIAAVICIMPGWDSMWLKVCQFCYLWSSAFCFLFFYLFCKAKAGKTSAIEKVLLIITGLLTGFSHEQTGISSVCAVLVYCFIVNKFKLNNRQKVLFISLLIGTFFVLINPNLWGRVTNSFNLTPLTEMFFITLPVVCLLCLFILTLLFTTKGRNRLIELTETKWIIFVIIAFTGSAIALYSRIIGRTGWLPQSAAIIAIALMLKTYGLHLNKIVAIIFSVLLLIFISSHYIIRVDLQRKLFDEYNHVLSDYIESNDGIVYYDMTMRPDFPKIILNKAVGIPDADDIYLLDMMANTYRTDSLVLTVLPTKFKSKLDNIKDSISFDGVTIYNQLPQYNVKAVSENATDTVRLIINHNAKQIIKPVTTSNGSNYWVAYPLIIDKGDHWFVID